MMAYEAKRLFRFRRLRDKSLKKPTSLKGVAFLEIKIRSRESDCHKQFHRFDCLSFSHKFWFTHVSNFHIFETDFDGEIKIYDFKI